MTTDQVAKGTELSGPLGSAAGWFMRLGRARRDAGGCTGQSNGVAWWELAGYGALLLVAIVMRLWDLGGRTLHYDEILHAWYAYRFSEGLGYSHTPLTHGPFLFHGAAATFAVLGSSDWTVRLLPALFGTALVAMP